MFFITHEETSNNDTAIVDIDGPLNSETSSDFDEYTSKLADSGIINLAINSEKIDFISSEGIGAVLLLQRKMSSINGTVVFFSLSREISVLFHLLGFDSIINTAPDRDKALEFINKNPGNRGAGITSSEGTHKNASDTPEDRQTRRSISANNAAEDNHTSIKPFVIECVKCSSPVRISMKGEHYCPYCSAPFTVSGEGNAIFRINDIPLLND